MDRNYWKKCSTCKKEIPYSAKYYRCSVSTCKHKRKGFFFCSVPCWDSHLGFMNHKTAWAEEEQAPATAEQPQEEKRAPVRKVVDKPATPTQAPVSTPAPTDVKTDTLVVVSKVKKLIKDQSGFNTSQCGIDALTKKVVQEALKGIAEADKAERKTVMGRDIK